jgi:hypothetical protein
MVRVTARSVVVFCLVALSCLTIGLALATAETISVGAGQKVVRTLDLNADDEVSGRITVVGNDESKDINFTVLGVNGETVAPTVRVVVSDFRFNAAQKGTYSLIFDNTQSLVDKTVSLNYEVRHYWFGMPQEFVLMLIIVFVGVLSLIVYAKTKK